MKADLRVPFLWLKGAPIRILRHIYLLKSVVSKCINLQNIRGKIYEKMSHLESLKSSIYAKHRLGCSHS